MCERRGVLGLLLGALALCGLAGQAAADGPGPLVGCKKCPQICDAYFGYVPTKWRPWPAVCPVGPAPAWGGGGDPRAPRPGVAVAEPPRGPYAAAPRPPAVIMPVSEASKR
jgi:hypothetical protein